MDNTLKDMSLWGLVHEAIGGPFWRYEGSLTTPPCYESVIWTIFHRHLDISKNQVKYFAIFRPDKHYSFTTFNISRH